MSTASPGTTVNFSHALPSTTAWPAGNPGPLIERWFQIVIFSALSFIFATGTLGNLMVCHMIRNRKNKRSIHTLTLNLAISDLIVLLTYLPMQVYLIQNQMQWGLGSATCTIVYSINSCTVNASIATLVAITRDRYFAVVKPMAAHRRRSTVTRKWILFIWSFSFLLTLPLLFVVRIDHDYCAEVWPSTKYERLYWIFVFVLQFVLPMIIISASYARILYQLKSSDIPTETIALHKYTGNSGDKSRLCSTNRRNFRRKKQQNKMLKMSIMLVVVYALCVLPQHVIFFAQAYGQLISETPYSVFIFITANLLMILNSAVNPVVYGTLNDEMKKGFRKLFLCGNYSSIFTGFRDSIQQFRLRRRRGSKASVLSESGCVQFEICSVTRIDNLYS